MDAFYASVEQLDHPELRGKPVLVGYAGPRGVVAAASYESRVFGCRSAQPMSVALRKCPHAVVMPVRFARYRELSDLVFGIFESCTPVIEPLSLDEAFLDVTDGQRLLGDPECIARRVKDEIRSTIGLSASVGIASNKFLAKIASDMRKPDALVVIRPENAEAILATLPVTRLWGVGPKMAVKLEGLAIKTVGDLRKISRDVLAARVGAEEADHLRKLSRGQDDRPVVPDREAKSIGQEQTFGADVADADTVRDVLLEQAEQVGRRLRKYGVRARAVVVKIRFGEFQTITRRTTLSDPTDATSPLWQAARSLFDAWVKADFKPVRLIGMTATDLAVESAQLSLFADPDSQRQRRLDQTLDQISGRFGHDAIRRGKTIQPEKQENRSKTTKLTPAPPSTEN
jgi:DNA polymerase-4